MTGAALAIADLRVRLPAPGGGTVEAVGGVSFEVGPGAFHGIVGESGSGKSTLLKAVLGLLPRRAVVSGRITTSGRVGIVFQEPLTALNPVMRVGDQIAEAPRHVLGLSARAARARAVDLMRQVGIPDAERRMGAYPHELSGGLRQRVLIAIALSAEPAVLLADEPTTALDVTVQDQILRLLAGIAEERRLAVVLVSHDLAVVSRVCDTVSVMYAGRFVETGPSGALLRLPLHPYTSGLLAAMPERGRGRQMLTPLPGLPPDLAALPPGCAFAPRCRLSEATCSTVRPPLRPSGVDRATACILEPTRPAQATA